MLYKSVYIWLYIYIRRFPTNSPVAMSSLAARIFEIDYKRGSPDVEQLQTHRIPGIPRLPGCADNQKPAKGYHEVM